MRQEHCCPHQSLRQRCTRGTHPSTNQRTRSSASQKSLRASGGRTARHGLNPPSDTLGMGGPSGDSLSRRARCAKMKPCLRRCTSIMQEQRLGLYPLVQLTRWSKCVKLVFSLRWCLILTHGCARSWMACKLNTSLTPSSSQQRSGWRSQTAASLRLPWRPWESRLRRRCMWEMTGGMICGGPVMLECMHGCGRLRVCPTLQT
mmetsp:Transcript_29026/g.78166  ORF Transcript_29026/g.78166 Transcript_29026/m.78166 type:complete len:203 (+) Transcript_29026:254-862(+)